MKTSVITEVLNIAFRALENSMKAKPLSDMDGFTPAQRFFLAWGRVWASNVAPQFVAYIVNSDVHSPSISRVNAALPMIDNWYKASTSKKVTNSSYHNRIVHTSGKRIF